MKSIRRLGIGGHRIDRRDQCPYDEEIARASSLLAGTTSGIGILFCYALAYTITNG